MNITVRTGNHYPGDEDNEELYINAKSWVIDESGRLHITKQSGGNAATYNAGQWKSVHETPEA